MAMSAGATTTRSGSSWYPDRTTYEAGQTAHVLVKSPFKSADALVTVERAGIYSRRRIKLSGPTPTIDVPMTDDLRPNAFVSVLLVRGRTKAAPSESAEPDVGAPTFRRGTRCFSINPEARRLKVSVKANKDKFLPGEKVEVDVDVRDQKAKAARSEVTLYAVDEGVLSLIGYKTPDPDSGLLRCASAPRFDDRIARGPGTRSSSAHRRSRSAGLDKGLEGGGGGGEAMRRDFRQSVYFNPVAGHRRRRARARELQAAGQSHHLPPHGGRGRRGRSLRLGRSRSWPASRP